MTYHFDWFHVESKRCSSELLLQTTDVTFSQDTATDLPLDYSVAVDESENIGEILVSAVNLVDVFSSAGPYTISLYLGGLRLLLNRG